MNWQAIGGVVIVLWVPFTVLTSGAFLVMNAGLGWAVGWAAIAVGAVALTLRGDAS